MGIDFGRGNGFMSEHFLHRPQISSAFNQMGSKGVPEGMRTDLLFYSSANRKFPDDMEYHDP